MYLRSRWADEVELLAVVVEGETSTKGGEVGVVVLNLDLGHVTCGNCGGPRPSGSGVTITRLPYSVVPIYPLRA
jgi:hypothetical protein